MSSRLPSKPTMAFHPLQQGIESTRADVVTMTTQLTHHPLPVDRALGGMMQNVDLPEAKKDLARNGVDFWLHTTTIVDAHRRLGSSDRLVFSEFSVGLRNQGSTPTVGQKQ